MHTLGACRSASLAHWRPAGRQVSRPRRAQDGRPYRGHPTVLSLLMLGRKVGADSGGGQWKLESGKWKVETGKWKLEEVEKGKWKRESGNR